jgi:hypothetical protein
MLKGKQKKLDANKDGKISGDDFKMMQSKKGMKSGGDAVVNVVKDLVEGVGSSAGASLGKAIKSILKKSESKDKGRMSDRELEFIGKMKPQIKSKGVLSDRELEIISRMKPEMKSKGGSIFSRKNYKRTGKI